MNKLVELNNNEPVTTTLIIADGMNVKHLALLQLVRKYEDRLKNKGTLKFEILKSGGRPTTFYYLNEQQTAFLITLMRNSKKVVDFKDKLNDEFYRMKKILSEVLIRQKSEAWLEQRELGKISTKEKTGIIKEFVEYATKQGSKSAIKYYTNISTMENKALFFLEQKFKNVRDVLTGQQLQIIATADIAVAQALKFGMENNMHYKDIYKLAKDRIIIMSEIIPKTTVPMTENKLIS